MVEHFLILQSLDLFFLIFQWLQLLEWIFVQSYTEVYNKSDESAHRLEHRFTG